MRCPVCKAENTQPPQCRRCKADLGLLWTLEDQRDRLLVLVRRYLAAGATRQAVEYAEDADWLRSDEESRRLLAVTHLLDRDFAGAWEYYRAVRGGGGREQSW